MKSIIILWKRGNRWHYSKLSTHRTTTTSSKFFEKCRIKPKIVNNKMKIVIFTKKKKCKQTPGKKNVTHKKSKSNFIYFSMLSILAFSVFSIVLKSMWIYVLFIFPCHLVSLSLSLSLACFKTFFANEMGTMRA